MDNINQLTITKRTALPVHLIGGAGHIKYFGGFHDQALLLHGEECVLFVDYEGNIIENIEMKESKNGSFSAKNATFSYSYKDTDKYNKYIYSLELYRLNKQNQLVTDIFSCENKGRSRCFWDGHINVFQTRLEGYGHYIFDYKNDQWEVLAHLSEDLLEYYGEQGSDVFDVNLKENAACFIVEETGQMFVYDYVQDKEICELKFELEGEISSSYFSANCQYYLIFEETEYQKNCKVYNAHTGKLISEKSEIIKAELAPNEQVIAFYLPNNKLEIYTFPELTLLATSDNLPTSIFKNIRLKFSSNSKTLITVNDDEAFFLQYGEDVVEHTNSYWDTLTQKLQCFYPQIETWKEENIKKILLEIAKEDERTQFIIKRELTERYTELLGEKHLFWNKRKNDEKY